MSSGQAPSPFPANATCWVATEGLVGLQNQGIGLAEALGLSYTLKAVGKPKSLWKLLPPAFWPAPLSLTEGGEALTAPWPDVVISAGRCGVAASLAIRKASGGKCFTVHIQDPLMSPGNFGAVIVPEHDRLRGANVLATFGAVHRVSAEKLASAAAHFKPLFESLPRPLIGVLIGGKSRHHDLPPESMRDLAEKLKAAANSSGGSLAVTPSRRTGADNEAILNEVLKGTPACIWDGKTENPYFGLLALADALVVTSDSISMISEACFTGKPVYIYDLPGGSRRFAPFFAELGKRGMVKVFSGNLAAQDLTPGGYAPLDETQRAADFVRARYAEFIRARKAA